MQLTDTIAAISTPPGKGGIGVVRLSGAEARAIAEKLVRFSRDPAWKPWQAVLGELMDRDGHAVDQVVVTYFAKPNSYTAEDVIEISCHGSPVVLRMALERACAEGARLAEPGEFTLRAYLNGRIDLARAEAVRDLIESTTLYQARVAARQVDGAISRLLQPVKNQLLELIALLEAGIDFAEDDISVAPAEELLRRLNPVLAKTTELAASFAYGKWVHQGFSLAIVGRPNVGKSSLFNRLLNQERAIVTEIAGTTRDLVSETAEIEGIPVRFVDTAGIRESDDVVESLGIARSHRAMADADLTLVVVDVPSHELTADDTGLIEKACAQGRALLVANKCDLASSVSCSVSSANVPGAVRVSALTGEGIAALKAAILKTLAPEGQLEQDSGFITSLRHQQLLEESREALEHALNAIDLGIPHEMLLLDLYAALRPIDSITGATTADDILHRIFSTFCIGK